MIRINLLPVKAAKKREAGQRQMVFLLLALVGAFGVILAVHWLKTAEIDRLKVRNQAAANRLAELKRELGLTLPAAALFESPTVASLARRLASDGAGDGFEDRKTRGARRRERHHRKQEGK